MCKFLKRTETATVGQYCSDVPEAHSQCLMHQLNKCLMKACTLAGLSLLRTGDRAVNNGQKSLSMWNLHSKGLHDLQ